MRPFSGGLAAPVFLFSLSGCCSEAYLVTQQDLTLLGVSEEPLRYAMVSESGEVWSCESVDGLPDVDCGDVVVDGSDWTVSYLSSNFELNLEVWDGETLLLSEALEWEKYSSGPFACDAPLYLASAEVSDL